MKLFSEVTSTIRAAILKWSEISNQEYVYVLTKYTGYLYAKDQPHLVQLYLQDWLTDTDTTLFV